jgi:hypothetical protein
MGKSIIISSQSQDYIAKNIEIILSDNQIKDTNSIDLLHIRQTDKQSIGIEDIKPLKTWAAIKPYNSATKIAIIEKAQLLTEEAQNSILKILEEPSDTTTIVLTTNSHFSLLPTIKSRCELICDNIHRSTYTQEFMPLKIQDKILFVRKLVENKKKSKDSKEIKEFLTNLMLYYGEMLSNNANIEIIRFNINLIQEADRMLNANVLPKLALENLVINLKLSN